MKKFETNEIFEESYLSTLQTKIKLADPNILIGELGRGSGKTTHIKAARIDRVQNSMPGSILALGAATYRDIFSNILPGVMEYFNGHYERGIYYEVGTEPPGHFKKCDTPVFDWKHTFSFHNGTVIRFISADRPESVLGMSSPHGFFDELLKIKKSFMLERFMPILRADRSKYGHSPYFMGWSGFTSTPNFETDEDWFVDMEKEMNEEMINLIIEIAYEIDMRLYDLEIARKTLDFDKVQKLERFITRWTKQLNELKRNQIMYIRASSFSNLKILGIDYIENQIKSTQDEDLLHTSIFAIRKLNVKDMFFGKFGKQHLFDDGYDYRYIDKISAGENIEDSCRHLRYYDKNKPLVAGYDPGPFSSMVFAQQNTSKKELRILKNIWVWHPDQHAEFAKKINDFFSEGRKVIYIYYDRAANQKDPEWKKYYPDYKESGINDTDAKLIKQELVSLGWVVHLMSPKQRTIFYSQHYRLLNILFDEKDKRIDKIRIDKNECEALVSGINHSPLKRHEGRIILDKSSERLPFEKQAYNSTQLPSALMYLLWGLYSKFLPDTDLGLELPKGSGTYSS